MSDREIADNQFLGTIILTVVLLGAICHRAAQELGLIPEAEVHQIDHDD